MADKIIYDDKGRVYVEDQYGTRHAPSLGQDTINTAISAAPVIMGGLDIGMNGLAKVVQGIAKKALTEEEYARLEEKQANVKDPWMSKIGFKKWVSITKAELQGNIALAAIAGHYLKKIFNFIKKLIVKE